MTAKSEIRNKFLTVNKLPYKNVYHISHSLSRFHRNTPAQKNDIPVFIRLELQAKDVGDFQIPGGTYKVYEKDTETLTYIGAASFGIAEGEDVIYEDPLADAKKKYAQKLEKISEHQMLTGCLAPS